MMRQSMEKTSNKDRTKVRFDKKGLSSYRAQRWDQCKQDNGKFHFGINAVSLRATSVLGYTVILTTSVLCLTSSFYTERHPSSSKLFLVTAGSLTTAPSHPFSVRGRIARVATTTLMNVFPRAGRTASSHIHSSILPPTSETSML